MNDYETTYIKLLEMLMLQQEMMKGITDPHLLLQILKALEKNKGKRDHLMEQQKTDGMALKDLVALLLEVTNEIDEIMYSFTKEDKVESDESQIESNKAKVIGILVTPPGKEEPDADMALFERGIDSAIDKMNEVMRKSRRKTTMECDEEMKQLKGLAATHPKHYSRLDPEPIEVIGSWNLNFNLGNVVKYVARFKTTRNRTDLEKAKEYLEMELTEKRMEHETKCKEDYAMYHDLHGVNCGCAAILQGAPLVSPKKTGGNENE